MKISLSYETDQCEELTVEFPARWVICDRCLGAGTHDPEAFSCGFSQADFDEDPDFREEYSAGRYDVQCESCRGTGKVAVADEEEIARRPTLAAQYRCARQHIDDMARADREYLLTRAAERRMGA